LASFRIFILFSVWNNILEISTIFTLSDVSFEPFGFSKSAIFVSITGQTFSIFALVCNASKAFGQISRAITLPLLFKAFAKAILKNPDPAPKSAMTIDGITGNFFTTSLGFNKPLIIYNNY